MASLQTLLLLLLLLLGASAAYRERGVFGGGGHGHSGGRGRYRALLAIRATRETNETDNIHCRLQKKVGLCRASFPRFFYDVTNETCSNFTYGGCDGNANNFNTREECEAACQGVTGSVILDDSTPPPPAIVARMAPPLPAEPTKMASLQKTEMPADKFAELCGAEPEVGPCRAAFRRWFYNGKSGNCQSFIYGGCQGNKNNYESEESCRMTCTVSVLTSKKLSDDDEPSDEASVLAAKKLPDGDEDPCSVTPDPGPCRAAFPMFYYDQKTASCQSFLYGGCRGNGNRFGTVEACLNVCGDSDLMVDRFHVHKHWSAAGFLFATLAIICVVLLVTLVIITLRRHRLPRRSLSISDKEELLPDDRSSVESLSVANSPPQRT